MKQIIKLIIIILLIAAASACSAKKEQVNNADKATADEKLSGSEAESVSDNYGGKGDRIKKVEVLSTEKRKTLKTVKNFINTDENMVNSYFLLSEISGKENIDPEDFEIGALYTEKDKIFSDAADLIKDFFNELKKENVKKELIDEENRFYLGKIFTEYIKENHIPEIIRIGAPVDYGENIRFNLRFLKKSGKTEGEIIIIKKKNSLFINGFKGDLSLLDSQEKDVIEKFEPEIFKFN